MLLCPIANWKKRSPNALAFDDMSYHEFNQLVEKLCQYLQSIPNTVISFTPQKGALDAAFFFASWRLGKTVYPLNPRLPKNEIKMRLKQTKAHLVDLDSIYLNGPLQIDMLEETKMATYLETSSAKKIVCHRLMGHLISAKNSADILAMGPSSVTCLNLPFFHVAGIATFLRAFLVGGRVVSSQKISEASHVSMVPTQLYRYLQQNIPLHQLQCLLVGGAPLSRELYSLATKNNLPLFVSYGMTETAALAFLTPIQQKTMVLPHIKYEITAEGEIRLRGPSLLEKYLGAPPRKDTDWFFTNDLGKFVDDQLIITGRKDRQFISGGENIQPEEIEQVLLDCPSILQARVEPIADPEFGMRPCAQIYATSTIYVEEVKCRLREKLPPHKIPFKIEICDAPFDSKLAKLSH